MKLYISPNPRVITICDDPFKTHDDMIRDIHSKEIEALNQTPIVQQTAFWSAVKSKLGASTLAIDFKTNAQSLIHQSNTPGNIHSDLLIILQQVSQNDCIAYVPYGPELEPNEELQGAFLEELSESLRSFLPNNCILIRYDLRWESYWAKDRDAFDYNGNWIGEPETNFQELRFNINTVNWNFKKSHFNILPSNTIFLNLQPAEQDILDHMKSKTRYNISLSQRKGVTIRSGGIERMDTWYALYRETAMRNNIYLNDIKYFEAILSARVENTNSPAEVQLLIAELDGIPLAAMFLIISGHRGSYLYGASSDTNRNSMATYALQWEAIKIAKARGCTEYDMFGIAPNANSSHPLSGLYKFKIGFGGQLYHSLGCWDYPLDNEKYFRFKHAELGSKGFHMN